MWWNYFLKFLEWGSKSTFDSLLYKICEHVILINFWIQALHHIFSCSFSTVIIYIFGLESCLINQLLSNMQTFLNIFTFYRIFSISSVWNKNIQILPIRKTLVQLWQQFFCFEFAILYFKASDEDYVMELLVLICTM